MRAIRAGEGSGQGGETDGGDVAQRLEGFFPDTVDQQRRTGDAMQFGRHRQLRPGDGRQPGKGAGIDAIGRLDQFVAHLRR